MPSPDPARIDGNHSHGPWFRAARYLRTESKLGLAARWAPRVATRGPEDAGGPTAPIRDIGTEETRSLRRAGRSSLVPSAFLSIRRRVGVETGAALEQRLINAEGLARAPIPRKPGGMREPALDEVRVRVEDECPDCVGECPLIARLDEEGGRACDLRQGASGRDDNGAAAGHRLKRWETEAFVQRWPGEAGGARIPGGEIFVGHVLREDDIVIEPERPDERKCPRPEGRLAPARAAELDEFEIAQAPLALERGERAQNRGEVLARVLGADEEDVALVEQPPLDGPEPRVVDTFVHDEDPLRGHTEVADDVALGCLRDGDQRSRGSNPGVIESEGGGSAGE